MKKISLGLATAGMFVLGTASSAAMFQEEAQAAKGFSQVLKEQF
ncbi:MAG: flagellar motor protein MotA, partial [Flavobacteriaceae bacterium]|nr:flagellar motor protein MotA [Flavobacteriaceae bacterium]